VVEFCFFIDPELCHQTREHKDPPAC
jgi:hypothetical protein